MNPGSCGHPLDCNVDGAPYTIIDIKNENAIDIEEFRVPVEKEEIINAIINSEQYRNARVWSQLMIEEMKTCRDHLFLFFDFMENYANSISDEERPYTVSTWENGFQAWMEYTDNMKRLTYK